ncbi:MAG: hypothetical protein LRS46_02885 [Desulfurococcales archaeon]|nr:hypothetical protein [Desulfurococcales archaeon]
MKLARQFNEYLAVLLLVGIAILGVASAVAAASTSGGPYPVKLATRATGVYGVYLYEMPPGLSGGISAAAFDLNGSIAVIGGSGYVAAVNLSNATLIWASSLQGTAIAASSDPGAGLAAVASDEGEVVVYSIRKGEPVARYYVGEDGVIASVQLLRGADGERLAVLTSNGYLRVYRVGSPYWVEIGPQPGEGPLYSVPGLLVKQAIPLVEAGPRGNLIQTDKLVFAYTILDKKLLSNITVTIYYLEGEEKLPAYSFRGRPLASNPNLTENAQAYVWITVYPYTELEDLSGNKYPVEVNYTRSIQGFYPGSYEVRVLYKYWVIDKQTGSIVSERCYTGVSKPIYLGISDAINISITAKPAENCSANIMQGTFLPLGVFEANNVPSSFDERRNIHFLLLEVPYKTNYLLEEAVLASRHPPISFVRAGARGVLALLYTGAKTIYLSYIDNNLEPVEVSGSYGELLTFESTPSTIAWSQNLSSIYIGTSTGVIHRLVWLEEEGRYVETNTMDVSGNDKVDTIIPEGGVVITVSAKGFAQAINLSSWRPLWRGLPGYPYLSLPLQNAEVLKAFSSTGASLVVVPRLPAGATPFLLVAPSSLWSTPPLHKVEIRVTLILDRITGASETFTPSEGSSIKVFLNGSLVAEATLERGAATLYLPPGSYNAIINATGWGAADYNLNVGGSDEALNLSLRFREVELYVYTPQSNVPGYQLVAGPIAGANVTLRPLGVAENLSYTPFSSVLKGTTGRDGRIRFIAWEGVEYAVTATKQGYRPGSRVLGPWRPSIVNVTLFPNLYKVSLEAVDSEALGAGLKYNVENATFTIKYSNGRSITVTAPNGVAEVELPSGNYTIIATAEGYKRAEAGAEIPKQSSITLALQPKYYTIAIKVLTLDNVTGLASGPLASARLNITLAKPSIPNRTIIVYTDKTGLVEVKLRTGTYKVAVWSPYTQPYTYYLRVAPNTSKATLIVYPRYANVSLILYDSELYMRGVLVSNATISIVYKAPSYTSSTQVNAPSGIAVLRLPYGLYAISVTAPAYEPYGPVTLAISKPNNTIRLYLSPVKYEVTIKVVARDPLWNLAQGPLGGAMVEAIPKDNTTYAPITVGYTDSSGTVVLLLRMGLYEIKVTHPFIAPCTREIAVGSRLYLSLIVTPNYTPVNIKVLDVDTGRPVPNATLALHYIGIGEGTVTLKAGDGLVKTLLPPGYYVITASKPGYYYLASMNISLRAGAGEVLTIHLKPVIIRVTLSVSTATLNSPIALPSLPLSGASIIIKPDDRVLNAVGVKPIEITTGANGSVSVSLRAGSYVYTILKQGFKEAHGRIHVTPRGRYSFHIVVEPYMANVTILLYDNEIRGPEAYNISNATMIINTWNLRYVGRAAHIKSNETLLLPVGLYNLTITAPGYAPRTLAVNISASTILKISLSALRYPVRITLYSNHGRFSGPVKGVRVIASSMPPLKPFSVNGTTSANGVVILDLRKGSYTIIVEDPFGGVVVAARNLTISGPAQLRLAVRPPISNVTFSTLDAEAHIPIKHYKLSLIYKGPYGTGNMTLTLNETRILQLPLGYYIVEAVAPSYEANMTKLEVGVATKHVIIALRPVYVPFTVRVINPDGEPIDGALVELHYEIPFLSPSPIISVNGTAAARGGIREGKYTLIVRPPLKSPYLPVTLNVTVGPAGSKLTVVLPYKEFNITILLKDSLTGKLIPFPYQLELQRRGKAKPPAVKYPKKITIKSGNATVELPYGVYEAKLKPVSKNYYELPENIVVTVDGNKNVTIRLKPRIYTVTITVVNDRSEPVAGALVEIVDTRTHATVASEFTGTGGTASFKVIYGVYKVVVGHPAYKRVETYIMVPQQASATITVYPTPLTVVKRLTPLLVGVGGLLALIAVLWRLKEVIASRLTEQEEYF